MCRIMKILLNNLFFKLVKMSGMKFPIAINTKLLVALYYLNLA